MMNIIGNKQYIIAPSILSADFKELGKQVQLAETAGADWIHIDIMDGHFVPNMSMGRLAVEACKKITQLPLDVHLMVREPEKFIDIFTNSGADHISIHVEATQQIHRNLQKIEELGCAPGIVINPGTPASNLDSVLHMVDQVLVMTVNPGYGAQEFLPEILEKITQIRKNLDLVNPNTPISVDGGISSSTIKQVVDAGAQVFIAGNAIFKHPDGIEAGIKSLKNLLPP